MQDLQLGQAAAQIAALVGRYPWQAFAVVMAVVLLVMWLIGDKPRRRTADFDFGLFDGDGDGGDGGGGD